jgi:hypothetical protein
MSRDSLNELAAVWTSLRRSDIFPVDARQVLRGLLLGLSPAVMTNRKLRHFIHTRSSIHDLTQAQWGADATSASGGIFTGQRLVPQMNAVVGKGPRSRSASSASFP